MPVRKIKDPSDGDKKTLDCLSGVVIVLGIVAFAVAFYACQDEALTTVDRLARYNLGFEGSWVLTVKKCAEFAAVAAGIIVVLAIVGLCGTKNDSKQLTCIYNVGLLICSFVMFSLGVQSLLRQGVMEPVIFRQVGDFCAEPTFIRLTQRLNCPNTAGPLQIAAGFPASPCNAACEQRALTLDRSGEGCLLLEGLCNNYNYEAHSEAVVPSFDPPYYSASHLVVPSAERCERKCDHDMLCVGFQYTASSCFVKSTNATRYTPPTWTVVSGAIGGTATPVQLKGENAVLETFTSFGRAVAWILLLIGVALCIMWFLTMRISYNQNFRNNRRPDAHQVGLMLCCPCCGGDDYKEDMLDDGSDYPEE